MLRRFDKHRSHLACMVNHVGMMCFTGPATVLNPRYRRTPALPNYCDSTYTDAKFSKMTHVGERHIPKGTSMLPNPRAVVKERGTERFAPAPI